MIQFTLASLVLSGYMTKEEADIVSARLHDKNPPHWILRPSHIITAIEKELYQVRLNYPTAKEEYINLSERMETRRKNRTLYERIFNL